MAIYKPVQTGVERDAMGDAQFAAFLSGADAFEGARLERPMAPAAAARRQGSDLPSLAQHSRRIQELRADYDAVIIEGSGGISVDLAFSHETETYLPQNQVDLMLKLPETPTNIIVARSSLGTLNHTALTANYLQTRGLSARGVIIGSWPRHPSTIEKDNLDALSDRGMSVLGKIPAGAGRAFASGIHVQPLHSFADVQEFQHHAAHWLPEICRLGERE